MAEPVNNTATLQVVFQALEDLSGIDGVTTPQFTYNGFNVARTNFTSASTPVVDRVSYQTYAIGGGGTTDIDLTALLSSQNAIDGTGKKVQAILVKSKAGNDMVTVGPGASNAYAPWGASNEVDIYATASLAGFAVAYQPEGLPDISGSAKNIRITGTAGDEVDIAIWLG